MGTRISISSHETRMKFWTAVFSTLLLAAWACEGYKTPYCGIAPGSPPTTSYADVPASEGKLVGVATMFRHGDRTPANAISCWPNDTAVWDCTLTQGTQGSGSKTVTREAYGAMFRITPVEGDMFFAGNCMVGQLTSQGYRQHIANGNAFRAAYVGEGKILPETFDPDTVYIETDTSIRVQMSAQAFITGMYPNELGPPATDEEQADSGELTMVDIHVRDMVDEIVNPNAGACPNLTQYQIAFSQSAEYANFSKTVLEPIKTTLGANFGINPSDVNVGAVFDCYHAHVCHGFELPPSVSPATWAAVNAGAINLEGMSYQYPSRQAYGRVSNGPWFAQLMDHLESLQKGSSPTKMFMTGAHDSSVMPALAALGVYGNEWTPYAGVITFELYATPDSGYAVRFLRYGQELTLPGCSSSMCPWSEFSSIISALLPLPGECNFPHASHASYTH